MRRFATLMIGSTVLGAMIGLAGCSTAPKTSTERNILSERVDSTIAMFKRRDSTMTARFDEAYGYAVFPEVTKGGAGIGGAHGQGQLFRRGHDLVGYVDVTQATVGAQIGGQEYSEIVFFQHSGPFNRMMSGDFEFAAQASAVATDDGASAQAEYQDGVMVFTMGEGGLMLEATVGGQDFDFIPKEDFGE